MLDTLRAERGGKWNTSEPRHRNLCFSACYSLILPHLACSMQSLGVSGINAKHREQASASPTLHDDDKMSLTAAGTNMVMVASFCALRASPISTSRRNDKSSSPALIYQPVAVFLSINLATWELVSAPIR